MTRSMQNLKYDTASIYLITFRQRSIYLIRLYRLIKPFSTTCLSVTLVDQGRIPTMSSNRQTIALLQLAIASDVITVIMRVDNKEQRLWSYSCFMQQTFCLLYITAKSGIDEDRARSTDKHHICTGKCTLEEE